MKTMYIAKQKIFNKNRRVFAYELLFRDHEFGTKNFPTHIQATAQVIINTLINSDINNILENNTMAFINVDEVILESGILDVLDAKKFVLEIVEDINLSEKTVARIKQYNKRGFKIALDDFDCSARMIEKFKPVLKYCHLIKMDILEADPNNLINVMTTMKKMGATLLAEKIETKKDYDKCVSLGFDLYQGYYLNEPEIIEVGKTRDITRLVVLELMKLIKEEASPKVLESYIKQRPDLAFKLIQFVNYQEKFTEKVESIVQIITLLGTVRLLKWLSLYIYSDFEDNPVSQIILDIAVNRAKRMEDEAQKVDKEKAYTAGVFSMLDALFEADMSKTVKNMNFDKDVADLIIHQKGSFRVSLLKSINSENIYLKNLLLSNYDKINQLDIIYALGLNDIEVNMNKA